MPMPFAEVMATGLTKKRDRWEQSELLGLFPRIACAIYTEASQRQLPVLYATYGLEFTYDCLVLAPRLPVLQAYNVTLRRNFVQ